jgi:hypothetical protein
MLPGGVLSELAQEGRVGMETVGVVASVVAIVSTSVVESEGGEVSGGGVGQGVDVVRVTVLSTVVTSVTTCVVVVTRVTVLVLVWTCVVVTAGRVVVRVLVTVVGSGSTQSVELGVGSTQSFCTVNLVRSPIPAALRARISTLVVRGSEDGRTKKHFSPSTSELDVVRFGKAKAIE